MNISNDNLCTFCKENVETIKHLFWECRHISQIWEILSNWFNEKIENVNIDFNLFDIIFYHKNDEINALICLTKDYIFSQKGKGNIPNIEAIKHNIIYYIKIQKKIYLEKNNLAIYDRKWKCFETLQN